VRKCRGEPTTRHCLSSEEELAALAAELEAEAEAAEDESAI